MAEVVLFHHAQGLTTGVRDFAETIRAAGHTVHTPDMYDGHTFETLDEGMAYAREVGFETVVGRGVSAAEALPTEVAYAGFSLGAMAAQQLAQARAGATAAVLMEACVPPSEFGGDWPDSVPVQVHGKDADPFFAGEGDVDAARALVAEATDGELFLYQGEQHLFADNSLTSYDAESARLLTERVLAFLDRVS
jgi:dienelactone hydrolase